MSQVIFKIVATFAIGIDHNYYDKISDKPCILFSQFEIILIYGWCDNMIVL